MDLAPTNSGDPISLPLPAFTPCPTYPCPPAPWSSRIVRVQVGLPQSSWDHRLCFLLQAPAPRCQRAFPQEADGQGSGTPGKNAPGDEAGLASSMWEPVLSQGSLVEREGGSELGLGQWLWPWVW